MSWSSVLALSLILNGILPQNADIKKWNTVEILCGKLIRSEEVPVKGNPNSDNEKTAPINSAVLRLYLRNEGTSCCERRPPVAEVTSGRDDRFEFKGVAAGAYWIVASVTSVDYKLAIAYTPDKKHDAKCSDILYALKKDQLEIERMVHVD